MKDLFDFLDEPKRNVDWKPQAPPPLDGMAELCLDCETNGLRWWAGDRPIGISIFLPDGRNQYLPWGHKGGGNLDEAAVKEWARRELRGKRITNLNTRFDIHMLREWGVDLEDQGCRVSDVGHYAALLDDHRLYFNLNSISRDYLGRGKVEGIDHKRMAEYHAGEVAPYAENDTSLVHELRKIMIPKLVEQGLTKVAELENELIYVVCEMEKNGCPIDQEKLERWIKESELLLQQWYLQIFHETGIKLNFGSNDDMTALFNKLGIKIENFTPTGKASFTDAILKRMQHPLVVLARRGQRLKSLRSKYLLAYQKRISNGGILRYALHQLRTTRDELGEDNYATGVVSGRFSSTEIVDGEGGNIQQVIKAAKQIDAFGDDFIIRELAVPRSGMWLSADAMQIEYRLFAHEGNNPTIIKAYQENPELSFHKFVHEKVLAYQPHFTYRQQKDLNFAKIYGAGIKKLALMLEFITRDEFLELVQQNASYDHPKLAKATEIDRLYNQLLPEVRPLSNKAMETAKNRGHIKTIEGRRARFPNGENTHKALNRRIQGSAADIMKRKLVELHLMRKHTGLTLRFTLHDEVDGDVPDQHHAAMVKTILNHQSYRLRVPILWDVKTGANWREAGEE
jgi:DNA polymerase I